MLKTPLLLVFLVYAMAAACLASAQPQEKKPFLHALFTDNMVLQRDRSVPVWGWTEPGRQVTIRMNGKSGKATADAQGHWMAHIGPFAAGGPYTLTASGPENVTVQNVLVGDVWICSGQSNMEMGIGNVNDAQKEISEANYPNIRLFSVPKKIAYEPTSAVSSHWDVCTPATVAKDGWGGFSAVAYFFGRHLHRELNVPIGLIHTSWGGTVAEAWTSAEALKTMDDFRPVVEDLATTVQQMKQGGSAYEKQMAEWWQKNDPGSAEGLGWADPKVDAAAWKTMKLPATWEVAGLPDYDGVVWFRKEFDLPAGWEGKDLTLHLGPIDDRDTTWVNGVQVGGLNDYNVPRNYKVPASALKPGRNVIAVRVLDTGGNGGIYGQPEQMQLEPPGDPKSALSLAGDWKYRDSLPLAKAKPMPQRLDNNPNVTTVLYNGMIAPLLPFGIKGAIWYQGESNAGRALQYRTLLPTLIKDWRARFDSGEFPFFIVQLANFLDTSPDPTDDPWPYLREAQLYTTQTVPKTALALAIDIGDAKDIHPRNKQEVGRRLALDALAIAYGQPVEYSGPAYRSMEMKGNAIHLSFSHLGGGLEAKGGKLEGFAIAGEDRHFVWADAKIEGDTVVVSSPKVEKPMYVRYAWANNPVANLYNRAGLPASPFRTDTTLK